MVVPYASKFNSARQPIRSPKRISVELRHQNGIFRGKYGRLQTSFSEGCVQLERRDNVFRILIWFVLRFILYFQELLLAEEWAKKNNVKFPPINAEEQFKKYGLKELYVFHHPTDPSCPIVMHFVMVNLTFREESAHR